MTVAVSPEQALALRRPSSKWTWLPPALLLPLAVSGPNLFLGLLACAVLAIGLKLLWRPGEPPILLFVLIIQWLQSATGALYANAVGVPLAAVGGVDGLFPLTAPYTYAAGLMLTGVFVLALAMHHGAGPRHSALFERQQAFMRSRPLRFWLVLYVAASLAGSLFLVLAPMAGGLRQPLLALGEIKWIGFVLLTFAAFASQNRAARWIWMCVLLFEVALGFGGYFSSFKEPIFYALIALAACMPRLKLRHVVGGGLLVAFTIMLSLVWTAVKVDYREFVSGGERTQAIAVGYSKSVGEFTRLADELDGQDMGAAADTLLKRVMYHHFFGVTASRVPAYLPHTWGEIWGEALVRPFMPRVLFPDKRAIEDSDLTNRYTGLRVAGAEQGTSISLGYMAEAYIDFGPLVMFAPIALLGSCLGFFYRWLLSRRGAGAIIGMALAPSAMMPAYLAETSILKMASSLVLMLLVCILVLKVLVPLVFRRSRPRIAI
jgi:hypothetical protein